MSQVVQDLYQLVVAILRSVEYNPLEHTDIALIVEELQKVDIHHSELPVLNAILHKEASHRHQYLLRSECLLPISDQIVNHKADILARSEILILLFSQFLLVVVPLKELRIDMPTTMGFQHFLKFLFRCPLLFLLIEKDLIDLFQNKALQLYSLCVLHRLLFKAQLFAIVLWSSYLPSNSAHILQNQDRTLIHLSTLYQQISHALLQYLSFLYSSCEGFAVEISHCWYAFQFYEWVSAEGMVGCFVNFSRSYIEQVSLQSLFASTLSYFGEEWSSSLTIRAPGIPIRLLLTAKYCYEGLFGFDELVEFLLPFSKGNLFDHFVYLQYGFVVIREESNTS